MKKNNFGKKVFTLFLLLSSTQPIYTNAKLAGNNDGLNDNNFEVFAPSPSVILSPQHTMTKKSLEKIHGLNDKRIRKRQLAGNNKKSTKKNQNSKKSSKKDQNSKKNSKKDQNSKKSKKNSKKDQSSCGFRCTFHDFLSNFDISQRDAVSQFYILFAYLI